MEDPQVPVIDWTTFTRKDGVILIVPTTYAKAINWLRFLNDFRIRRELLGSVIPRS